MEEGYAAASMSAIAARVGGSKGTLYNYFRSKAELFTAMIREDCERGRETLFDLETAGGDLEKMLLGLGRGFVRLMLSEDILVMHRIVVAESSRFPEIGEAYFEAGPKRGKALLVALLVDAVAEGKLKPLDADRAADQLAELFLAGLYRRRLWNVGSPPTEADIEANVQAAVAVFMAAYGAR
jgi:AcrR family transcriptional regulator